MTTTAATASSIKFGTDGWRAIIAEDYTFDNVRLCAQALSEYLKNAGTMDRGVVIGYDTRFGSDRFAAAAAEVIAGNGIKVALCSVACPTPVVSFTLRDLHANAGIVITASHNPGDYNGFKIKDEQGASAAPEMIEEIEGYLPKLAEGNSVKRLSLKEAQDTGLLRMVNPVPPYEAGLRSLITEERLDKLRNAGLEIVVDSMYGAGAGYLRRLLRGGSTKLVELNGHPNPAFPGMAQPEPITRNLKKLSARVRKGAAVGLATDGDADRLGVVDEHGEFVTQLQVYALLCYYLLEERHQTGALVKSITTSSMIYRLGEQYNVPVSETNVGFKYVGPEMIRLDALIGGEESGGYGFRGHLPERDGVLAGLYFLDLMVSTGKSPSQLIEHLYSLVGPHYYDRDDFHFAAPRRSEILGLVTQERTQVGDMPVTEFKIIGDGNNIEGVRLTLQDKSWLLIRFSGTEPLLRVYAEASSQPATRKLLALGQELAHL